MEKTLDWKTYLDKVYGAYLGKTVVGTLGAPFEGIKMPLELTFDRRMIDEMLPNDDLDLQVLWLDEAEERGAQFTSRDLQRRFAECCDYSPGEYAILRKNYLRGIAPPLSGKYCNDFYINGMGCPIRSEIWACLSPLDPGRAAEFAARDGVIDHAGDSVEAECFLAALESAAFGERDLFRLIEIGLQYVSAGSRFRALVEDTLELCQKYEDVKLILRKLLFRYGHPDCTNLYQNMGITLTALLKGNLDFIKTGMDALNCGFDTDCTCATAGAVIGFIRGAASLREEYRLGDVRYVLGVRSHRRSDLVSDLAEDIALLGAQLCSDRISGAPEKRFDFSPSEPVLGWSVCYRNDDPTFYPGHDCVVTLRLSNRTGQGLDGTATVEGLGLRTAFRYRIAAGKSLEKELVVHFPEGEQILCERNLYRVECADNAGRTGFSFGVVGAIPWKVLGPFWRTDPICTTELLEQAGLVYGRLLDAVPYDGAREDVMRRFHLNFCPDTESHYATETDCFRPYVPGAVTPQEETVFYQTLDSFRMEEITPFGGPSVLYLSRELISDEARQVWLQIGHSAPFTLFLNGKEIAKRTVCDTFDAENVHVPAQLEKGINRLVFRLTRVNGDAKFGILLCRGAHCAEHEPANRSTLPEFFTAPPIL